MLKKLTVAFIKFYRSHLSGLKSRPTCRFIPTCSAYALDALAEYGFVRGSWLALGRLLRCRPSKPFGIDPVPIRHRREGKKKALYADPSYPNQGLSLLHSLKTKEKRNEF